MDNIILTTYATGIVVSSFIGIKEQLRSDAFVHESYSNFAINCIGGAMSGAFVGIWWPITLVGLVF
jgi:hypothetical protein